MKRALIHSGISRVAPSLMTGGQALLRRLPRNSWTWRVSRGFQLICALLPAFILLCLLSTAALGTPLPGTLISNTAKAAFVQNNQPASIDSNQVDVTVRPAATPAVIELLQLAPETLVANPTPVSGTSFSPSGRQELAGLQSLPAPVPFGQTVPVDIASPLPLTGTEYYHAGQIVFVQLSDGDQNLFHTQRDTVWVTITCEATGDIELLLLTETSENSGVFTGYLPSLALNGGGVQLYNGQLHVEPGCQVKAEYVDPYHPGDRAVTDALVDPLGIVFNSRTGDPVNGAEITLFDMGTNQPAIVFGDDGISNYPATIISGGTTTDASGTTYNFEDGGFRYPYIAPGTYRLVVTPPGGYTAPSEAPEVELQQLPNAPFAIGPGSFGETFSIPLGPAIRIDVPVDPMSNGLWIEKESNKKTAAPGDFVAYTITIENSNEASPSEAIVITDQLPAGFRYQPGSLFVDGVNLSDPLLSTDGRTMTISLGDLPPEEQVELRYLTSVGVSTRMGEAINQAQATDKNRQTSNIAEARVDIHEDLVRSHATIAGRVMASGCSSADIEQEGLANVRLYLEDGTSVLTDQYGNYHVEGIEPGLHVVQLDLHSLPPQYEITSCTENSQFAQRAFSQFVDVHSVTLWRTELHVALRPKAKGEVSIALLTELVDDIATMTLPLDVGKVPVQNARLTVLLPKGMTYLPDSSLLDNVAIADPKNLGGSLIYRLGDQPANQQSTLQLRTRIERIPGSLPIRAILTVDTPEKRNQRTPIAENLIDISAEEIQSPMQEILVRPHFESFSTALSDADRLELGQVIQKLAQSEMTRIVAVGHTDNVPIAERSRNIFPNNYALGEARAKSVVDYITRQLALPAEIISQTSMGASAPVTENVTEAGKAKNRRVELRIHYNKKESRVKAQLTQAESGVQSVETTGLRPGETLQATKEDQKQEEDKHASIRDYNKEWLKSAAPGSEWLWPEAGHYPSIPSTRIAVKHHPREKAQLLLNGEPVSSLNFDGTIRNDDQLVAISFWRGVDIKGGDNQFEVLLTDSTGRQTGHLKHTLHYAKPPVKAELLIESSNLSADGLTPPQIAVQLTDENGHPAREGIVGQYQVLPPYRALQQSTASDSAASQLDLQYTVGKNGVALIDIEPTTEAGQIDLKFHLATEDITLSTWLTPAMRDWILVGFAQGTVGYNTLTGNMESLATAGMEEDGYTDGRVKFFAKGAIKGEWLLSMAYDSDKADLDGESLHQQIDPDAYYPLYGDSTQQNHEAASADNLYVKIERKQFYAMFGDIETGLNVTELARYSRNLNGFKTEWHSDHLNVTAFASETKQAFVKDEIRGDGTSGLYHLSADPVVINSEQIVIETRGRLHDEVLVNIEPLSRHTDYEIDYDDGTLFFKKPIPSRDADFNPIYIVVRYETVAAEKAQLNYGVRAAVKLLDEKVEIGTSYIHEETGTDEGDLVAVDATIQVTENTKLRLEAAQTDNEEDGVKEDGSAYLAELEHSSADLSARIYYRQQDEEFGLGQQNISENGTRKVGAEVAYQVNNQVRVGGEVYRQDNLETDATRDVAEADVSYGRNNWEVHAGYRDARDEFDDNEEERSSQILAGAQVKTLDGKLALRADHEQSLGNQNENSDFPTRTVLGADYFLNDQVSLFAEQEYSWGEEQEAEGTRAGFNLRPWNGSIFDTSIEQQITENGRRVAALLGLQQTWQVNERWALDASLDRNQTLKSSGKDSFDNDAAPAINAEDFTSISLGSSLREDNWSWNNRIEMRTADSEDRWGLTSGIITEPAHGIAYSGKIQMFITDADDGSDNLDGDLRFGLAYRPTDSRWILLDRLDFYFEEEDGDSTENNSWRLVNNFNANYKPNRRLQIALQYGLKYVRETIDGYDYDGFTDLVGTEMRYNITSRWDIGLHGSLLHSWNNSQFDYSIGTSIGYAVMTNTWISLGYNLFGFEDEDFSSAHYTAQGFFLRFRIKFDQQTVREAAEWLNR